MSINTLVNKLGSPITVAPGLGNTGNYDIFPDNDPSINTTPLDIDSIMGYPAGTNTTDQGIVEGTITVNPGVAVPRPDGNIGEETGSQGNLSAGDIDAINNHLYPNDGTKITVGVKDVGEGKFVTDTLTITNGDHAIVVSGIAENKVRIDSSQTQDPAIDGDPTAGGQSIDAATDDGQVLVEDGGVNHWRPQ